MRSLLPWVLLAVTACTASSRDEAASGSDAITDVSPTVAKDQSIGNCWLYATAAWTEAMHNEVAHEELDLSESYWTYWHWFNQLTSDDLSWTGEPHPGHPLDTGGQWRIAAELIARYGYMSESDFLPEEGGQVRSQRQQDALRTITASVGTGGPFEPESVLDALDQAFGVRPEMSAKLRALFGQKGERTFHDASTPSDPSIHRARELSVAGGEGLTLADVLGETPATRPHKGITVWPRTGPSAWQVGWVKHTPGDDGRENRALEIAIQKTLHTHRPVFLAWAMDVTHLDATGAYRAERRPGILADEPVGHLSVITDYQVVAPGFGLLPAGVNETRPEALAAALDPTAQVQFFRIKNSAWGTIEESGSLPPFADHKTGYNDLYLDFLNGPALGAREWSSVILPPDALNP